MYIMNSYREKSLYIRLIRTDYYDKRGTEMSSSLYKYTSPCRLKIKVNNNVNRF